MSCSSPSGQRRGAGDRLPVADARHGPPQPVLLSRALLPQDPRDQHPFGDTGNRSAEGRITSKNRYHVR